MSVVDFSSPSSEPGQQAAFSIEFALLSRHRRGRKTKTSSDASQEAPERARKDTPKEAKLQYEGSYPSVRLYKDSFSGFLATRPKSAGVGLLFFASLRGKSVLSRRHRHSSLPRNGFILYHKIRSAAENAARTDSPPQTYPGSLCRTLLVSILLYEQPRQI